MLNVSVEDFGPIIDGHVELRPLTIFLGPSNSGKSYMATMIYGLMNTIGQSGSTFHLRPGRSVYRRRSRITDAQNMEGYVDPSLLDNLQDWARQVQSESAVELSSLPSTIQALIRSRIQGIITGLNDFLNDELANSHGSVADLVRRNSKQHALRVKLENSVPSLSVEFNMLAKDDGLKVCGHNFDIPTVEVETRFLRHVINIARLDHTASQSDRRRHLALAELVDDFASITYATLAQPFPANSYYLPAARSGITQGHKVIASTMVRLSNYAGLRRIDIPTLPGVITDFMSHMLLMETAPDELRTETSEGMNKLEEVIRFLERQVVRGTIEIEQDTDAPYPEIYYEPIDGIGRFSFNRTSSMVSELAPVILFLKHIIEQGDLLILEEPESHLHPASQRQMARAIVRLVNAGVKVIITTHSDLFLGAINNLMKLSSADEGVLKELGREHEDRLNPQDVAAYQFVLNDQLGGSEVRRLEIGNDVGINEDEFASVVEDLYDESVLLQRRTAE